MKEHQQTKKSTCLLLLLDQNDIWEAWNWHLAIEMFACANKHHWHNLCPMHRILTCTLQYAPLHRRGTDDITHVFWSTTWNDVKPWCGKTNPQLNLKLCFTMLHMFSYSLAFHAVPMCKHWSCSLVGSEHRWWCLSMVGHFHCSVEIFNLDSWSQGKSSI
jgi:hypothetical protein